MQLFGSGDGMSEMFSLSHSIIIIIIIIMDTNKSF